MTFRKATQNDLEQLRSLGIRSWSQFKDVLSPENWNKLYDSLCDYNTYSDLLGISECFVCENKTGNSIGMAFLVPSGNPTDIYDETWCQLRYVSVDPEYRGRQIAEKLTGMCIDLALKNGEDIMALHTSEIMKPAQHIYKKLGFKVLREIEPRYGVRYWLFTLNLRERKR